MRIALKLLVLMLIVVATSCKPKMTMQEYNNHDEKVFLGYCTNDVKAAEEILLADIQTISGWERNHLEGTDFNIDYDALRARDHQRLFLIYRALHETNKMELEFQLSLQCMARSRARYNKGHEAPQLSITQDDIVKGFEKLEGKANVRWKTNIDLAK